MNKKYKCFVPASKTLLHIYYISVLLFLVRVSLLNSSWSTNTRPASTNIKTSSVSTATGSDIHVMLCTRKTPSHVMLYTHRIV